MARRSAAAAPVLEPEKVVRPNRSTMRAEWRDPDDIRPGAAKTARTVHGWRSYCPLRRMGAAVSVGQIMAADKLRELYDVARVGYAPIQDGFYVATTPQPRPGPTAGEMQRARAGREYARAIRPFTPVQRSLITAIILDNKSVRAWTLYRQGMTGRHIDQRVEQGRLLAILDQLAAHFDTEIREELQHGWRLPP